MILPMLRKILGLDPDDCAAEDQECLTRDQAWEETKGVAHGAVERSEQALQDGKMDFPTTRLIRRGGNEPYAR